MPDDILIRNWMDHRINRKFQTQRSDICRQIQQELIHWHTPKHGIRSREELKEFASYRELIESKRLMDHNLINPAEDIILEQGKIQVRNLWFYKKWGLLSNEDFFKL